MAYTRLSHAGGAVPTTLTAAITSGATTATIADATGWTTLGTAGPFYIVIYELTGTDPDTRINEEKIQVTSISGTGLSGMTRAVDGTTAVAHASGSYVEHVFTAAEADEANATAAGTLGKVAAKGDVLTGSAAQTLVATTVGADNTVLIADSTKPGGVAWSTVGTANVTDATLALGDLNAETNSLVSQDTTARTVSAGNIQNVATLNCTTSTYTDFGGSITVTVPSWATKAIVRTNWCGLHFTSTGTFGLKTLLGGTSGTVRKVFGIGSTVDLPGPGYVDKFTGLSGGALTLKTQTAGDGSSPGSIGVTSQKSAVDFDIEFIP
jgi:hypothetical protein